MRTNALVFLFAAALVLSACPTPPPTPQPPAPKVVSFTAAPAVVAPGATATLSWEVTDATQVDVAEVHAGAVPGVDNRASGSVTVTPASNALYVLTALNSLGVKVTAVASVSVKVEGSAPIFAAVPPVVGDGQSSVLVWSAPGAKSVSIAPTGGAPLDLQGQVEAGQVPVNPVDTQTTYVLTADEQSVPVVVTRGAVIDALTLSPPSAKPGATVTVGWTTRHADDVTLSSPSLGTLLHSTTAADVANGSFAWTVPDLRDGTLVVLNLDATGPGNSTRRTVTFVAGDAPKLLDVTAPPYPRLGGDFTVSWKSQNADAVEVREGALVTWRTANANEAQQGSVVLPTPAGSKTYTVAAVRGGLEDTRTITVDPVGPVSLATFIATPATVPSGGSAITLTWNAPSARRVRIEQDDALTVVWVTGVQAESGTATAYGNQATTHFKLSADNTLDAPLTATADVAVTSVVAIGAVDGGQVFENRGTSTVDWAVGSELEGVSYDLAQAIPQSTGFDDISTTGAALSFNASDDGVAFLSVPGFETFLYGTRVTTDRRMTVSVNGVISLKGQGLSFLPPDPFPYPWLDAYDLSVAPFWTDLVLGAHGHGYWQVKGTAPNQKLIVQWDRVGLKGLASSELTFQVQIAQTGAITFEYRTLKDVPASTPTPLLVGVHGTFARGVRGVPQGQQPVVGTGLRFFAPREKPLTAPGSAVPFSAFARVGQGFMPISVGPVVRASDFHISEVMVMPAAAVPAGEWFEVRNSSPRPVDLRGWDIDFGFGNVHTIARSVVVPAGGTAVLGQSNVLAQNDGVTVDYAYGTGFSLSDTQGTLFLRSGGMAFGAEWGGTTVGGAPVPVEGVATVFDPTLVIGSATTSKPVTMPCSATQTYGSQLPPQHGSPGVYHSCRGYVLQRIDGAYQDISTTGTRANLQAPAPYLAERDGYAQVDVSSAPVSLFGVSTSVLTASVKGVVVPYAYTAPGGPWAYSYAGTLSGAIAPMWTNFDFSGRPNAGVFYQRFAAGQSTVDPRAHWIIQWNDMSHLYVSSFNDHINVQVKFFDSGDLEYHYGVLTSGSVQQFAQGTNSVVWLERVGVPEALAFSAKTASLKPNMGLRFTRVP